MKEFTVFYKEKRSNETHQFETSVCAGSFKEAAQLARNDLEEQYEITEIRTNDYDYDLAWYAVQEDVADSCDFGSFDFDKAKEMLKEQGKGNIAVILDDVCVEVINYNELF